MVSATAHAHHISHLKSRLNLYDCHASLYDKFEISSIVLKARDAALAYAALGYSRAECAVSMGGLLRISWGEGRGKGYKWMDRPLP